MSPFFPDLPLLHHIYIDAYNLLFWLYPQIPFNIEDIRFQLIQDIRRFSKNIKIPLTLIFDGKDGTRYPGYRFTAGVSADEELEEIAQAHQNSKKILIVTSDRSLQDKIQRQGLTLLSCELFWKKFKEFQSLPQSPPLPNTPEDTRRFLHAFSELDPLLASISTPSLESKLDPTPLKSLPPPSLSPKSKKPYAFTPKPNTPPPLKSPSSSKNPVFFEDFKEMEELDEMLNALNTFPQQLHHTQKTNQQEEKKPQLYVKTNLPVPEEEIPLKPASKKLTKSEKKFWSQRPKKEKKIQEEATDIQGNVVVEEEVRFWMKEFGFEHGD
jgi:predicted RNA-binding protein with PIN domain